MTDSYNELREGLERLKAADGVLRGPEAQVAALLAERDALKHQLEWTERYALDTIKTDSKDMDDWRGDVQHIANSARSALSQSE